jgi:3-oxoacyl-[acyl-carrier-protein] synthase III
VRAVVDSARAALERADMKADDVDWFVPHQANARIIEAAAHRLGIDPSRTLVNIDRYGNTSSASIPLALFEAVNDGRVREGDVVLCSGFGAGMTWASAVLEWNKA